MTRGAEPEDSRSAGLSRMLETLALLVRAESPSTDHPALARCAALLGEIGEDLLGVAPTIGVADGVPRVHWKGSSATRVLILGHFDTVWPLGSDGERDFRIAGGRAYGPGVFDMKAGLVQTLHALRQTGLDGVEVLFTGDEEIGSPTSERLISERAAEVGVVLVAEPAAGTALKTARKGTIQAELRLHGTSAHAGLEPERGVSTTLALGPVIDGTVALADPGLDTTVVPTLVRSGSAGNVVPDFATVNVDVRAWSRAELDRVARGLKAVGAGVHLVDFDAVALYRRDPLTDEASDWLFTRACEAAAEIGLPPLAGVSVGGCSDGNLAAAAGARTLDGLGPVGGGAHAVDEFVEISEMAPRSALLARLIEHVRRHPGPRDA